MNKSIEVYLTLGSICHPVNEFDPAGVNTCVVYSRWIDFLSIEVAQILRCRPTWELSKEVRKILRQHLIRVLQPMYIADAIECKQELMRI